MFADLTDRQWLWCAAGFYTLGLLMGTVSLLRGQRAAGVLIYGSILAGYLLQFVGLGIRGHATGGCPLGNRFEIFQFTAWSAITLYLVVGATWCEPCQRFHHAAERGELDAAFPTVTLLEFDLDRDHEGLASAGYVSKYIPLFALPGPDGKASGKAIEGGIKGDGAVGFIVPRLKEMLSD